MADGSLIYSPELATTVEMPAGIAQAPMFIQLRTGEPVLALSLGRNRLTESSLFV